MIRHSRARLSLSLVVLLLAAVGCGSRRATVYGKVTVHGKPVTEGTVSFVGANNEIASATLDGEGNYASPKVPRGTVKVGVQTLNQVQINRASANRPKGAPPLPSSLTNLIPVPAKYADPQTSGLSCDVQQARQEFNIDLP